MPYRPGPHGASRGRRATGNGNPARGSYASRLAIARSNPRSSGSRGPSLFIALALVLIVTGVTIASAGVIAAGGVAGVTVATLDQGLPDVRAFRDLGFPEPTRVYDRSGKHELARFWEERREVVEFEDIPPMVLDVTTAVEDDTFWDNPGFDLEATLNALVQEAAAGGAQRGASTITQQLVRARLLPTEIVANDDTVEGLYLRKAKELIQAFKLTQAFPGEEGKREIITAYLNEISYYRAYGISAAADVYFGKELDELSVAEAALLAAIPQSPALFDPYDYARKERLGKKRKNGKRRTRLVIDACGAAAGPDCERSALIVRRDFILRRLKEGNGRWTTLSDAQFEAALNEDHVLRKPKPARYKAPHFVNALVPELDHILADREPKERGGYSVITTLDWKAQRIGEKVVAAGARVPNLPPRKFRRAIRRLNLRRDRGWISRLRGANIRNGALVALDYRTGDILAYVGSAGYYRKKSRRFDPKYDHAGQGRRQPGSAWKPIVYATGIDTGALTAGSVLLDITTPFGRGWAPKDADRLERGPILVREALMYSLNIPAVRALHRTGVKQVRRYATRAGLTFLKGPRMLDRAGLAGAIGTVEVRPIDLAAAYGAFGNGGKVTRPRHILKVLGPDGEVIYEAGAPISRRVWKPTTAYIVADILSGNTNPRENSIWGPRFQLRNGRKGKARTAALKTGTTNDLKDFSTYGLLPKPKKKRQPALALGIWFGNSDSSRPSVPASNPIYSSDIAGEAWHAFVRDYMKRKPTPKFKRPKRVVTARIDRYSGGRPGPWTRATTRELFIRGTQPGGKKQVDPPGLIYSKGCGAYYVQPARAENRGAPRSWVAAVDAWASRGGLGRSRWGTRGTYFTMAGKRSFGGAVAPGTDCGSVAAMRSDDEERSGSRGDRAERRKKNGGGRNDGGGGEDDGGGNEPEDD